MRKLFSFRLGLLLFCITLSVMSASVGLRYAQNYQAFEDNVRDRAGIIASRISDQVEPAIWEIYLSSVSRHFPEKTTSAILNSEMKNGFIDAIVVYGRFGSIYMGRLLDGSGFVVPYDDDKHAAKFFDHDDKVDHAIKSGSMTIGKVSVYYNDQSLRAQLAQTLKIEVLQVILVTILIISMLYFSIKYALTKPLESLEIARSTISGLGEGVIYMDNDGLILDVNPAFFQMTGYHENAVIQRACHFFLTPDIEKNFLSQVNATLEHGQKFEGEAICRHSNGSTFPVFLTVSDVFNDELKALCRVVIFQDISDRKKAEKQLRDMAFRDVLTGLPNRHQFEQLMHEQIKQCAQNNTEFGLLFIDLDGFKYVNDVLGHTAGDHLLVEFGRRFKNRLRAGDHIARLGGDEFVVITADVSSPHAIASLAGDLVKISSDCVVFEGNTHRVGSTIGISVFPKDGTSIDTLIRNADSAMYYAKQLGKRQYAFYQPDLGDAFQYKQKIKSLLSGAIERGEFHVLYQPKLKMRDINEVVGVEALVRWNTKEYDFVSPDEFIPIAEESSLILDIGQFVIEEAFAMASRLTKNPKNASLIVSINLSAHQLKSDLLVPLVLRELRRTNVRPQCIEFEITESVIIEDFDASVVILSELKRMGFSISLDDFGSGYSSLSCLTKLPVDILKIDQSFVFDIGKNVRAESVIESIIVLAKSLELKVIAEGIEEKTQLEFLVGQGCDFGQGYYFSKPVSEAMVVKYIAIQNGGSRNNVICLRDDLGRFS